MTERKMQRKSRALLIFMKDFHPHCALQRRSGAAADARKLFKVLSRSGFQVKLHFDLTAQEVMDAYRRETAKEHGDYFLSVLSSHGDEGVVYCFDGCQVKLASVFKMFVPKHCPGLAGKTKMFFVQACRGEMLDPGVDLECDGSSSNLQEDSFCHYLSIPEDTTVMFASSPGFGAFQNPSGSIFLQTLCALLDGEERELELSRLLTRISHMVAYQFQARGPSEGSRQMPCIITTMTREVCPFARNASNPAEAALTGTSRSHVQAHQERVEQMTALHVGLKLI